MNERYQIRYLKTAEKDLLDIFEYITTDRPIAAESLLEKFDHSISQLAEAPFIGVIPKDERLEKLGYRMLIVDRY